MWILKSKWIEMQRRIQKLEIESTEREDRTRKMILDLTKRILEQPEKLLEEIRDVENIEQMVDKFIRS